MIVIPLEFHCVVMACTLVPMFHAWSHDIRSYALTQPNQEFGRSVPDSPSLPWRVESGDETIHTGKGSGDSGTESVTTWDVIVVVVTLQKFDHDYSCI